MKITLTQYESGVYRAQYGIHNVLAKVDTPGLPGHIRDRIAKALAYSQLMEDLQ